MKSERVAGLSALRVFGFGSGSVVLVCAKAAPAREAIVMPRRADLQL